MAHLWVSQAKFRKEKGMLFVDESGQLQAPWQQGQPEFGVVAGLIVPDRDEDRTALRELVRQLRLRVFGNPDDPRDIKARMLKESDYDLIAREVRNRWVFGHPIIEITSEDLADLNRTFSSLPIDILSSQMGPLDQYDLRLSSLIRQYERALSSHTIYLALLFRLYRETARWFRKNSIQPLLRTWLDDKLPRQDRELLNFLGRFAIYSEFPEIYGERLSEVLGLAPSMDFECSVSSDRETDGLVIADAIAYATSRVARDDDPGGRYKRAIDRMNVDLPWT